MCSELSTVIKGKCKLLNTQFTRKLLRHNHLEETNHNQNNPSKSVAIMRCCLPEKLRCSLLRSACLKLCQHFFKSKHGAIEEKA